MSNNNLEQNLENSESTKDLISKLIRETLTPRGDADRIARENETSVTSLATPEAKLQTKRDRKQTEKGIEYQIEIATKNRNAAHSKLTKQIKRIYSFLHDGIDQHSLEIERNTLDSLKEEFNEAHAALNNLSHQEDRNALYHYFDLRDREYMECRTRISERLHEQERAMTKTTSVKSFKSRSSSRSSRCSRQSVLSKKLEAETKAAKLAIELQYLEQDIEVRKLQLQKEAALAMAEASATNKFLKQMTEDSDERELAHTPNVTGNSLANDAKASEPSLQHIKSEGDERVADDSLSHKSENKASRQSWKSNEDKDARDTLVGDDTREDSLSPRDTRKEECSPLHGIKNENDVTPWYVKKERYDPRCSLFEGSEPPDTNPSAADRAYKNVSPIEYPPVGPVGTSGGYGFGFGERTFRELIRLQEKQTELSAMIVNQQRRSALPVQEPPTFSGDFLDYPIFVQAFEAIIEDKVDTDKDRLYFLNKFTTGKANDVVKGFVTLNVPDGYKQARNLLTQRFGNPHHVAEAYKSRLRRWPRISDEDGNKLQEFSDFLVRCKEAMETLKYMDELNSSETLITISAKLPPYAGVKWCRHARELHRKTGAAVSFKNLVDFIREESELANDPVFSPNVLKKERNKVFLKEQTNQRSPQRRAPGANALLTSSASSPNSKSTPQCPLCKKGHYLEECKVYLEKEVKQRVEFIRSNGLCFGCLRKGHLSKNCRKRLKCKECSKSHPTSIHDPGVTKESASGSPSEQPSVEGASSRTIATESVTNSMILPVWLHHKDHPEREVMVYALLDNASDTTFIKSSILKNLDLEGPEMTLKLHTMHGRADVSVQKIEGLLVDSFDRSAQVELPKAYSRDNIPFRRNQIPTPQTAKGWPHLKILEKEIRPYKSDIDVGLLIGCNCPRALKPAEVIPGGADDPYAVRTLLGWGIIGPVMPHKLAVEEDDVTSHRILCSEVGNERQVNDKFSSIIQAKEVVNPLDVKAILEADFTERDCSNTLAPSREDRQFLAIVSKGIKHLPNGHYELPLPLKPGKANLPNNREMAVHRLKHLKKRMESDAQYKEDYTAFMKNMIDQGHAEKVPEEEVSSSTATWFIPHHGVYHPKKQKMRVVFDCSAQFRGESLNKHLLQGPDLTNSLVGVLCRFREEPVAFICDVEGMFHQVQVKREHRDLLRFLWWEDGDTCKAPEEYRMTVHLFGATSSPGCANFAFKSTADDHEKKVGSAAAEFLRKNFYVDDGLKSVATTDEATRLIRDAREMCQEGGFNLHKFISNDKEVIASVPIASRAEDVKTLDLSKDTLPVERALGVQWCVENDHFNFRVVLDDRPTTRRGILSTVSSVFDPLGFVAPFVLEGKRILQELCRDKIGWDDPVRNEIKTRWHKWKDDVRALAKLTVERCYKPADFGLVVERELHHFSDASTRGYGQCSYMRLVNDRGHSHCSFIMGKARVTPLKPVTVPRLELTAALISTRISDQIKRELQLPDTPETFWTDSKVVLGYLNNDSRRFHIFVANRVQEIQERTSPSQWRYVNTESNPADDASRGLTAHQLHNSRWIKGPEFLWKPKDQWPQESQDDAAKLNTNELSLDDPEVKRAVAMTTSTQKLEDNLADRVCYFSDWHRAKRSVALCVRYVRRLRENASRKIGKDHHVIKDEPRPSQVTAEEMSHAETLIIRATQDKSFKINQKSILMKEDQGQEALARLGPFVDRDGIIRVGGRLRRANLESCYKFPAILPKKGHVSSLVIKHYHERLQHQGRSLTLNEIRSNGFWIMGGSTVVGSLISKCVTCRKLRGLPQEQRMADLPEDRVEPAAPFTSCAVDYFGPWIIRQGRKDVKRYGVLFTCMASRAIHLEVSSSLETDSFINALRRFLCRRGPVRQIRCDQGTNFVGARNELKRCLQELDHHKISSELLRANCDWFPFKMNVPSASHMGGVWERQIRSVRNVLQALLISNGEQLDEESLNTFMCEAEAIVNSRPLTVDSLNDPDSLDPLTPNHLLTLKTKILLPPPSNFQAEDLYSRRRWRRVQHLSNEFWSRWKKEYLLNLQPRSKWIHDRKNLELGDIVIVKDQDLPRNKWELGRVLKRNESQDGCVRSVQLLLADPSLDANGRRTKATRIMERPIHKLVLLSRD